MPTDNETWLPIGLQCAAMAAVGRGGGSSALRPIEISDSDSDSSQFVTDSDSDDSFDMDQVVCEYRTAEYYNDECSRYLDCPSHLAQRDTQEGEIRDGEDKAGDEEMTDVGDGESRGAMSSTPAEVDIAGGLGTATDPIVLQDSPVQQRIRPGLHTRRSIQSDGASGPDQPSPVNADPRQDRVGGTWRSSLRDARPARSNAVPAPVITLPRWQPDSEVTYCPICFTQFGMFVRKHHCRYVNTFQLPTHDLGHKHLREGAGSAVGWSATRARLIESPSPTNTSYDRPAFPFLPCPEIPRPSAAGRPVPMSAPWVEGKASGSAIPASQTPTRLLLRLTKSISRGL